MKKTLLTVAMLLSAAGMQAMTNVQMNDARTLPTVGGGKVTLFGAPTSVAKPSGYAVPNGQSQSVTNVPMQSNKLPIRVSGRGTAAFY